MSIAAMINSIKNNRRKDKTKPFPKYEAKYKKGRSIQSKELSPASKKKLLTKLKKFRTREDKIRNYKLIISFSITILVVIGIASLVRLIFF